jgi:hypothetical protein
LPMFTECGYSVLKRSIVRVKVLGQLNFKWPNLESNSQSSCC